MADESNFIDAREFARISDEPVESILNLSTWSPDPDLGALIDRIEREVGEAVERENAAAANIRRMVFPLIGKNNRQDAPPDCGVYRVDPSDLKRIWSLALFNGGVEACDGTRKQVATLPLTITQLGVCLVSYRGDQQSFAHRIFQRDLRGVSGIGLDDVLTLLDQRARKDSGAGARSRDGQAGASGLLMRGLMTYAERAVLTDVATAPWRIGHGQPAPYELLTGAGLFGGGVMPLLRAASDVLRRLVLDHRRFVFVPSEIPDGRLLTIANALRPCEYAIVTTARQAMTQITNNGNYRRESEDVAHALSRELGPEIAVGVYRASEGAPPQIFYSHVEHSHEAALIALADSLLQQHRGFPLLIGLADRLCQSAFGNDIFDGAVQSAFARAKAPYQYLGERTTR
jgi:hypothetical protein